MIQKYGPKENEPHSNVAGGSDAGWSDVGTSPFRKIDL